MRRLSQLSLRPARRLPSAVSTIERVTLIVAWRDPFCLVADSLESSSTLGPSFTVGWKKIIPLADDLVLGFAGPSTALPEIEEKVRGALPTAGDWWTLLYATQEIVGEVNDRTYSLKKSLFELVTVAIVGTVGSRKGLFDMGPLAMGRELAPIARRAAVRFCR